MKYENFENYRFLGYRIVYNQKPEDFVSGVILPDGIMIEIPNGAHEDYCDYFIKGNGLSEQVKEFVKTKISYQYYGSERDFAEKFCIEKLNWIAISGTDYISSNHVRITKQQMNTMLAWATANKMLDNKWVKMFMEYYNGEKVE